MLFHVTDPQKYSESSINLPLTYISLTKWILVRLQGEDIIQYVHNQFTCDIKNLNKNQYTFSAHCNPKGKVISNMYVFYFNNQEIAFIQRRNICTKQIAIMKKYDVFSKIKIIPDYKTQLIGIVGKNARQYLNTIFPNLPNETHTIVHTLNATILYFNKPKERFLLVVTDTLILDNLLNQPKFKIQIRDNYQWITLDIESGYPWIKSITSEKLIPQAINMDILQGVSFNKGCYVGQECITRIQYRGGNKKMLFQLIHTITEPTKNNNRIPKSGEYLSLNIKDKNEKYMGLVLQTSQINKCIIWIQIVLDRSILKYYQKESNIKTIQINNNFYSL